MALWWAAEGPGSGWCYISRRYCQFITQAQCWTASTSSTAWRTAVSPSNRKTDYVYISSTNLIHTFEVCVRLLLEVSDETFLLHSQVHITT